MLNTTSTYAQAKGRGALFTGLMVSAGPANDKIYMRCVDLIANTIKRSKKDVPSYGITNSTFWVKVKINKLTHQSSSWFLSFEQVWCDYLEFYRFVDGKWSAIKTGDREVFSTREVKNRNFDH